MRVSETVEQVVMLVLFLDAARTSERTSVRYDHAGGSGCGDKLGHPSERRLKPAARLGQSGCVFAIAMDGRAKSS